MSDREVIKIAVSPAAKAAIEEVCARYGMSQIELASRVYQWFAEQDEVLQAGVLNILPRSVRADVVRQALESLAAKPAPIRPPRKTSKPRRG